jgi:hypothetical protein
MTRRGFLATIGVLLCGAMTAPKWILRGKGQAQQGRRALLWGGVADGRVVVVGAETQRLRVPYRRPGVEVVFAGPNDRPTFDGFLTETYVPTGQIDVPTKAEIWVPVDGWGRYWRREDYRPMEARA